MELKIKTQDTNTLSIPEYFIVLEKNLFKLYRSVKINLQIQIANQTHIIPKKDINYVYIFLAKKGK